VDVRDGETLRHDTRPVGLEGSFARKCGDWIIGAQWDHTTNDGIVYGEKSCKPCCGNRAAGPSAPSPARMSGPRVTRPVLEAIGEPRSGPSPRREGAGDG